MTPFELDHFTGYLTTNAEYEADIREQQERNRWHEAYQSIVIKIFPDWCKTSAERHLWQVVLENANAVTADGYADTFDAACSAAKYAAYDYADLVAKGE